MFPHVICTTLLSLCEGVMTFLMTCKISQILDSYKVDFFFHIHNANKMTLLFKVVGDYIKFEDLLYSAEGAT